MEETLYEPDPPTGDMDQYIYRELQRIADTLISLQEQVKLLEARVTALETP